ncbi:MAG: MSMEG_4193 family putative phosphomutase [Acidimicrobiaceae bacterium]|nr:MSMEG_4193 family putative phosphomutase [Acidimicrobiaceae bacterium]
MPTNPARGAAKAAPVGCLVLLVRHGQTPTTGDVLPGRAPGLHLAPEGVDQARAVAERVAGLGRVKAVYASPMERAVETAAPIARACGLRVRKNPGLIECDFGRWTGRKLKTLSKSKECTTVQLLPSGFRLPGGESFAELRIRALDAVAAITARHPGQTVVAVSHADVIKAVAAAAAGTPLDMFQRIVVSPCSITAIAYHPAGPILLTVNNTGDDLAALAPS